MLDEIVRSAAQLLDAPVEKEGRSWLIDAWVFLDPHDEGVPARRQIVQLFVGESGDLLYLSSTVGAYREGLDLAPLLREMVGAVRCSLHLSRHHPGDPEHLRIGAALETEGLDPMRLAAAIREVGLFADRFEAQLFGADVR